MPRDKVYHFIAGVIVSVVTIIIVGYFNLGNPGLAGFFMATMAGCAKELYDHQSYGVFDVYDLLATMAGGATAGVLF